MNNKVLDEIKNFAIQKLKDEYGYCGCADSPDTVMINSDDRNGKDIKIVFTLEDE